jgi:hypothetical protein
MVLYHCGDDGLIDLLLELATYLEEPLTIQAAASAGRNKPIRAQEWYVRPGASEVEVNEFKHASDLNLQ